MAAFGELGVCDEITEGLEEIGWNLPTDIQAQFSNFFFSRNFDRNSDFWRFFEFWVFRWCENNDYGDLFQEYGQSDKILDNFRDFNFSF